MSPSRQAYSLWLYGNLCAVSIILVWCFSAIFNFLYFIFCTQIALSYTHTCIHTYLSLSKTTLYESCWYSGLCYSCYCLILWSFELYCCKFMIFCNDIEEICKIRASGPWVRQFLSKYLVSTLLWLLLTTTHLLLLYCSCYCYYSSNGFTGYMCCVITIATLGCLFVAHGLSNVPIFEDDVLFYFAWRVHPYDTRVHVVLETKTQKGRGSINEIPNPPHNDISTPGRHQHADWLIP